MPRCNSSTQLWLSYRHAIQDSHLNILIATTKHDLPCAPTINLSYAGFLRAMMY